jgi:uncharacterized protein YkwD
MIRILLLLLALGAPALACEVPAGLAGLRAELLALTNSERAAAGLPALTPEARLDAAAQAQACRIAESGQLTHRGSWFAGLGRRLRREGYGYAMAVENIGSGQRTAAEIMAGWRESPGHRVNLLAPDAREAGFGVARGEDGLYWAMVAAAER